MNYATIRPYDVANGEGIRVSLFVSGCRHKCKECFNEKAWDFLYGEKYTIEEENRIIKELSFDYYNGLSILGGEPLEPENQEGISKLVLRAKKAYPNKSIWLYSGFTWEQMQDMLKKTNKFPYLSDILNNIDILVDGRFVLELKNLSLAFRGSSNQRVIDVKQTIEKGKIIHYIK